MLCGLVKVRLMMFGCCWVVSMWVIIICCVGVVVSDGVWCSEWVGLGRCGLIMKLVLGCGIISLVFFS